MKVKIIVDSTADLTPQVQSRVQVIPLTIRFGDKEYIDGVTIDSKMFYEMLTTGQDLPTTSQATPFVFEEAFEKAVEEGYQVVVITVSSKLSGTYQSAVIAAEEFPGKVFVVDSKSVAIGSGILTEYALELIDRGLDAENIAWKLMQKREEVRLVAVVDTLEYLKRGGRISKTAAIAGGLLSIKPVIGVEDGEIRMLGKARGAKQAGSMLLQEIEKAGGIDYDKPLLLGYTGTSDESLKKFIEENASAWERDAEQLPYTVVGSVVGTHAGPGAVAAAFFSKNRAK
jgi:DegV family protein with EDD domain